MWTSLSFKSNRIFIEMNKVTKKEITKIVKWVEWRDIDIQYDLFNKNKFRDNPALKKFLK